MWVTVAVALIPFIQFLWIAFGRLTYPFEIEWMEGAILGHGIELARTGEIYKAPSLDFVPFIYPPLYTYITALGIRLFGISFVFPRLVSILSFLGSGVLMGSMVWRETRRPFLSVLAFLVPFGAYGVTGYWFDLVRVDGVALALVMGGAFALVYGPRRGAANVIAGAVLLGLAAFGKQSFLLFALAVVAHLALSRAWRDLAVYGIASVAIHALLWGGLYAGEGRLAFTYVFDVPQTHGWWKKSPADAFALAVRNLYTFRPVLVALAASVFAGAWLSLGRRKKDRLFLFSLFALTSVVISLVTRAKWGGYENAFIPAYFFLSLLTFYSVGAILGSVDGASAGPEGPSHRWPPVFATVVLMMVLVSSVTAALSIDVPNQRVRSEQRHAVRQLSALVRAAPGRVLIPSRNAAVLTGRLEDNHYHAMAARDLSPFAELYKVFEQDNETGLQTGRFPVILLDVMSPQLESRHGYRRMMLDEFGIRSGFLGSMTGKETVPRYLYCREGVDLGRLYEAVRGIRPDSSNE